MKTDLPNTKPSTGQNPFWEFLAEYRLTGSPRDEITDMRKDGLLFQALRELGVPTGCLHRIETTLMAFLNQAMEDFHQGKRAFPVGISLYARQKRIVSGNSTQALGQPQAHRAVEPAQVIHSEKFWGWSYFIIERAPHLPPGSSVHSPNCIDLYLYREGE